PVEARQRAVGSDLIEDATDRVALEGRELAQGIAGALQVTIAAVRGREIGIAGDARTLRGGLEPTAGVVGEVERKRVRKLDAGELTPGVDERAHPATLGSDSLRATGGTGVGVRPVLAIDCARCDFRRERERINGVAAGHRPRGLLDPGETARENDG